MPGDPAPSDNGTKTPSAQHADGVTVIPDEETSLAAVHELLADLKTTLETQAEYRERIIDRLHEENQRLRRDELATVLEPVRAALFRLYDKVRRQAEDAEDDAGLTMIADELADVLAHTGVEVLPVAEGEPYDPARHRAAEVRDTTDAKLDGTVAAVRRDGFARGEQVVRRAEVIVARIAQRGE